MADIPIDRFALTGTLVWKEGYKGGYTEAEPGRGNHIPLDIEEERKERELWLNHISC